MNIKISPEWWEKIPAHLVPGLELYFNERIPVGHFLTAVLQNDLRESVGLADEHSLPALSDLVRFLYMEAPAGSWGSREAVKDWLMGKGDKEAA